VTTVPAHVQQVDDVGVAAVTKPLALLAALAAMGLAAASIGAVDDPTLGAWVRAALVTVWAVSGIILTWRGVERMGAVVVLAGLAGGACAATAAGDGWLSLHALSACLLPAIGLHIELTIPEGRTGGRGRRLAILVTYGIALVVGAAMAVTDRQPAVAVVVSSIVVALLIGLPAAHQTYLHSTGIGRQRLQLVGCAVAVVAEAAILIATLRLLVDWPAHGPEIAASTTALLPMAMAAGTSPRVVRRVDRVLFHTVSATGLTAVVVAVYLVIVVGLGRVPDETERTLLVLSMVAAAVASLAYVPARQRLSETANRLVYGERHPPDEVLRTWGSRLNRSIPMDELLLQLAESLRKVMVLRRAEVWTGTPGRLELAVSVPDREATPLTLGPEEQPVVARAGVTGNAWLEVWLPALLEGRAPAQIRAVPAAHAGELLGLLVVERALDTETFTDEDDRVLTELARQVGLALHNVQLDSALQQSLEDLQKANDDLRASRARIVASGDAERRKIERNLHDGAQQHLVALAVNLRLARDILTDDPETAAEMLEGLASSVKDTIQELRDLAHGIYPPLLVDSGLPEALRAAAGRSPLSVSVVADGVARHGPETEAAVYFCCLEALQNAAKHAPDAEVSVRVWESAGELFFEVADNGPGFDKATATRGHGYINMSDRLGAIGGSVEWRSMPGAGATVAGRVPV
jgi:signal transduction histidine kinase